MHCMTLTDTFLGTLYAHNTYRQCTDELKRGSPEVLPAVQKGTLPFAFFILYPLPLLSCRPYCFALSRHPTRVSFILSSSQAVRLQALCGVRSDSGCVLFGRIGYQNTRGDGAPARVLSCSLLLQQARSSIKRRLDMHASASLRFNAMLSIDRSSQRPDRSIDPIGSEAFWDRPMPCVGAALKIIKLS